MLKAREISMKIASNLYQLILHKTSLPPPETGGILGGQNGIITNCCFDNGQCALTSPARYQPDTDFLNQVIQEWKTCGIQFYGLFHSHYSHDTRLSLGDKRYITKIMLAMPSEVPTLYFPLILPRADMISYQANRSGSAVRIVCDKIELLKMEVVQP